MIVVVNRERGSNLARETTWGSYSVIDMWYYNLGMDTDYLHDSGSDYYKDDIKGNPLQQLADLR